MNIRHLALTVVALTPLIGSAGEIVDLQWSICDANPSQLIEKLKSAKPDLKKQSDITYYDTNPPTYAQQGLSFRTKSKDGKKVSSVKVRFPQATSNVPNEAECSWDRYGMQETYTCEIQSSIDHENKVWSEHQTRFVEHQVAIHWDKFVAFGPFNNPKWTMTIQGLPATFDSVEAGPLHLMELSVKVDKNADQQTYKNVTAYLRTNGVSLCPLQESKTNRLFRAIVEKARIRR